MHDADDAAEAHGRRRVAGEDEAAGPQVHAGGPEVLGHAAGKRELTESEEQ